VLAGFDLECRRGGRTLFRSLSLSVEAGERLRIAGANGSGKTSLLRILCGLLTPSEGQVRWRGTPIAILKEEFCREIVYLGHAPAVKDDLTPAENLEIACRLSAMRPSRDAMGCALGLLKVPDQPIRKLSQGQKRRAALARLAMSERAALWLLDEPYAALDAEASAIVDRLIDDHAARGGAVVFTTHQETGAARARVLELHA
jgi:heme exporter protein A